MDSVVTQLSAMGVRQAEVARDPLTIEIVCDRVANDGLTVSAVAQQLGVRGRWLRSLIYANPEWREKFEQAQAMLIDQAVSDSHGCLMAASEKEDAEVAEKQLKGSLAVAQHWFRERYGARVEVNHGGSVSILSAIEEAKARAAQTIEAPPPRFIDDSSLEGDAPGGP